MPTRTSGKPQGFPWRIHYQARSRILTCPPLRRTEMPFVTDGGSVAPCAARHLQLNDTPCRSVTSCAPENSRSEIGCAVRPDCLRSAHRFGRAKAHPPRRSNLVNREQTDLPYSASTSLGAAQNTEMGSQASSGTRNKHEPESEPDTRRTPPVSRTLRVAVDFRWHSVSPSLRSQNSRQNQQNRTGR